MKIQAITTKTVARATHTVDTTEVIEVERKVRKNGKATGLTETVNVTVPKTEYAYDAPRTIYTEGDIFHVTQRGKDTCLVRHDALGIIRVRCEDFKVLCEGKGCTSDCHTS